MIFGFPLILLVLALLLSFRGERIRREHLLPSNTPRPLLILYRPVAFAILAFVAYMVFMSVRSAVDHGII